MFSTVGLAAFVRQLPVRVADFLVEAAVPAAISWNRTVR
jgi:hypothetical protein